MPLNPNRAKDRVNDYASMDVAQKAVAYPQFFEGIHFDQFRHIHNLLLEFKLPIMVIAGSNRSGKTSTLMAIACSHYHFMRRNVVNGNVERARWGDMMRFTSKDVQAANWTYTVTFRIGEQSDTLRGTRNVGKKWSGVAKKKGQIGHPVEGQVDTGRHVLLIDLNRINPGRHLSIAKYMAARNAPLSPIPNSAKVWEYLSYIMEQQFEVREICQADDGNVYAFDVGDKYSSFNSASGEDVLMMLLVDILNAPENSLILIDEIEIGLHPKLQRRLMNILYIISNTEKKQFIITTHSYAILNSVSKESRIFIDNSLGIYRAIQDVTTEEALTRMDADVFPAVSVYVEDEEARRIVEESIRRINVMKPGFGRLVSLVDIGAANLTYQYFKTRQLVGARDRFTRRAACILDGDRQGLTFKDGSLQYPPQPDLFFLYSNEAPEKMLVREYLAVHQNLNLQYHLENSNPHCLFEKMVEFGIAANKNDAIDKCLPEYINSLNGQAHLQAMEVFLEELVNT